MSVCTYLSSARVNTVCCQILHRRVRRGRDQGADEEASQLHRHQDDDDVRQLPRRHALYDRACHLRRLFLQTDTSQIFYRTVLSFLIFFSQM